MNTPLQIAFKNTDSSEFFEALIRERADRLERFHSNLIGCRVVVEVPHRSESGKPAIGVAVEVEVPGRKLVARAQEEMRESKGDRAGVVNRAFDAMQRQLEDTSSVKRGQVKQHASLGETGRIARLFAEQNYGFVEVKDGGDLYFTRNAVAGDSFDILEVGTMVRITRATTEGPMGPQASLVQRLGAETSA